MGGEIGVESDGHTGSTFWFSLELPVAIDVGEEHQEHSLAAPARPIRLLLAEDNPANVLLVQALLQPFDIAVAVARDGQEALAQAKVSDFDIILMDMQMPAMDGPSAARAIRNVPGPRGQTPIIALTANVLPEQIAACKAAGMQWHVSKPISPAVLLETIAQWSTGNSPTTPARAEPNAPVALKG